MEISIKGKDHAAVKAEAKRLVAQNPHYSPAVDSSLVGQNSVFTITVMEELEMKWRAKK